jgi:hypothetical protein
MNPPAPQTYARRLAPVYGRAVPGGGVLLDRRSACSSPIVRWPRQLCLKTRLAIGAKGVP